MSSSEVPSRSAYFARPSSGFAFSTPVVGSNAFETRAKSDLLSSAVTESDRSVVSSRLSIFSRSMRVVAVAVAPRRSQQVREQDGTRGKADEVKLDRAIGDGALGELLDK